MRLRSALSALGIAMAMVVCLDYLSYAATGHSFILGRANSANAMTSLTRTTAGTALNLASVAGSPPLRVNQSVKAPNLNADMLDGFDYTGLSMARVFTRDITTAVSQFTMTIPLPVGKYVVSYSAVLFGAAGKPVWCRLNQYPGLQMVGESSFDGGTKPPGLSGTGFVTQTPQGHIDLDCGVQGGTFTTLQNEPIQVVAQTVAASNETALPQPARPLRR